MFQLDNTTATVTSSSFLAANAIHKVKFEGAEKSTVGDDKTPVVAIKFSGIDTEGTVEDKIFQPMSDVREKSGPKDKENPSQVEQFQTKLRQYIAALNPALDKAINDGTKKIGAKDWEGMRDVIVAALNGSSNKNIGRETELKLVKNKKGYASVPAYVAGLTNKDGKVFHSTKFIGDKVTFTDYEMNKINKEAGAVATPMPSNDLGDDLGGGASDAGDLDDFDVNDL